MKNKKIQTLYSFFSILTLTSLLLVSCKEKKPAEEQVVENQYVAAPPFNADSAYTFVQEQVDFGPRVPNTPAHLACGDYLIKKLTGYGAEMHVQQFTAESFDGKTLLLRNIIASLNPEASKRILLAAHWDTRPFADKDTERKNEPILGANDGGSGVAVLLEIARSISANGGPQVGVDIVLFDGEDYGEPEDYKDNRPDLRNSKIFWCLGSQHWSRNKHLPDYSAYYGILLDMVGGKNAKFYREGFSMQWAPLVVKRVWDTAHRLGHGNYFISQNAPAITDDHVFVNELARINMIDIIEFDPTSDFYFGKYHHTHADNMDLIDKNTMKAVGETVLNVIYNE